MPCISRLSLAAFLTGIALPCLAEEPPRFLLPEDDKSTLSLIYENDIFGNSDSNYTNGVRLAWSSSEKNAPAWAKWSADNFLPLASEGKKRISLAVGQNIYTPHDINTSDPIHDDRPYAGWLYGSIGVLSDTGNTLDNVMLTLGVVGPMSLAEPTQEFVHDLINAHHPNGWGHQLDNEPGIVLTYERKWRALYQATPFGIGADITPHAAANLGNVDTSAIAGLTFRLGYDLPADYGPPRIRPSVPGSDFFVPTQTLSGYLFAGVEGRGVLHNIFLDGNTFSNGISVDKKPLVGGAQLGAVLTYGEARLSYTHVFLTKEFEEQRKPEQFGVVTLSFRF